MKDNLKIYPLQVSCVVNSFQNCIFKDERQHVKNANPMLRVVNSFQNCIFKDERQLENRLSYFILVVNSFQNCIFKDERQPQITALQLRYRCE